MTERVTHVYRNGTHAPILCLQPLTPAALD